MTFRGLGAVGGSRATGMVFKAVAAATLVVWIGAAAAAEKPWKVTGFAIGTVKTYTKEGEQIGEASRDAYAQHFPAYVSPDDVTNGLVPVGDMADPIYVKEMFLKIEKGVCPPSISSAANASSSLATSGAGAAACE